MKINIQWKGTDICADFTCECGIFFHFDGYFCYAIECPDCRKVFKLSTTVVNMEVDSNTYDGIVIKKERDGFIID